MLIIMLFPTPFFTVNEVNVEVQNMIGWLDIYSCIVIGIVWVLTRLTLYIPSILQASNIIDE